MMYNFVLVLALAVFGASAVMVSPRYAGYNSIAGYGTCGTAVADTCRCVKTVVRPPIVSACGYVSPCVESIPYTVSRRVNTPAYAATGVFPGSIIATGGVYGGGAYSGLGYAGGVLY